MVFALALALVVAGHSATRRNPKLDERHATAAVLARPQLARYLHASGWNRTRVLPLDEQLTRVSFLRGRVMLLDAAVAANGEVRYTQIYLPDYTAAGSPTAQYPAVLLGLCLLFALMTITLPLRRIANLDVLALIALAATIFVLNKRLFEPSVLVSTPALLYLIVRCAYVGLGRGARGNAGRPLFTALTARASLGRRRRLLALILAGTVLMAMLLVVPGGRTGDVGLATLSGATALTEGKSPYGNVTADVVHGDTYPFFMYLLYTPAAWISPVHNGFDSTESALWVAAIALVLAAAAIFVAVKRTRGPPAALRQTIAWLVFAPVLVTASAGSNDLVAAALVALAVASIAQAGDSSLALAAAAWAKVVPVLILPLWLARLRSQQAGRAVVSVAALSAAVIAVMLAVGGPAVIGDMLRAISFQAARGTLLSVWSSLDMPLLQAAFLAAVLTFAVLAAARAWRDPRLAGDHRRICALAAVIVLGLQLAANYWSYRYLPWAYPLVAAALLWPAARDDEQSTAQAL